MSIIELGKLGEVRDILKSMRKSWDTYRVALLKQVVSACQIE